MKLSEITHRESAGLDGWIAVIKGGLWQSDINNVWVFNSIDDAWDAFKSDAYYHLDNVNGDYFVVVKTLNNIPLILRLSDTGMHDLKDKGRDIVLAYSITKASCRAAAEKATKKLDIPPEEIWVYKTWNSNPDFFKDDQ